MEPPPKALLIIADGVLDGGVDGGQRSSLDAARPLPHLDGLARAGGSGLLVLDGGGGGGRPTGVLPVDDPAVLAQLLGVAQSPGVGTPPPTLESRFQGMRAALMSDDAGWRALASTCGVSVAGLRATPPSAASSPALPLPASLASRIVRLLGLGSAPTNSDADDDDDDDDIDAVLVHVPPPSSTAAPAPAAVAVLAWLDALLADLGRTPAARTALITCVILGGPAVPPPARAGGAPAAPPPPSTLPPIARPAQTWEEGGATSDGPRPPVRTLCLTARLAGVVRTDGLTALDPAGAAVGGALGTVRAAHLLPELAYKMGRAPKYGA